MQLILILVVLALGLLLASLRLWRASDVRAERIAWDKLTALSRPNDAVYSPELVSRLPEPAQRYFNFTIKNGAPLVAAAIVEMNGEIGIGTKSEPNYQRMRATQILAPPYGFVWKLKSPMIVGSDGLTPERSWTRFWLFGIVPIVRESGPDHQRSAFGRLSSEAVFWVPASLLPGKIVHWEPISENSARAVITYGALTQAVDITVNEAGAPTSVAIERWSNANPEKVFREQSFGGHLSEFREFDGYTIPTRVEGGNLFGSPDYYPFFKANVTKLSFPDESMRNR